MIRPAGNVSVDGGVGTLPPSGSNGAASVSGSDHGYAVCEDSDERYGTMSRCVPPLPCAKRAIGSMYIITEKQGPGGTFEFSCVAGPCWPMMIFTFLLIAGVYSAAVVHLRHSVGLGWILVSLPIFALTLLSFLKTACSDPGILPRYSSAPSSEWTWNAHAKTFRPPGALYDSEARCVIEEIDHFCPWTGTVIGKGNLRCFRIFVSNLCILVLLLLVMFLASAFRNE